MDVGVLGAAVLIGAGSVAAVASWRARHDKPFAPGTQAARRDTDRDPLARPLRNGCAGAEISIWLDDSDRLQVGTARLDDDPGNAIGPLVLRRLAERVERNDRRVHRGQRGSFILLIEILETEPERIERAYRVLDEQLREYPGLCSRVDSGTALIGPVTVLLTGASVPRELIAAQAERYVFADGSFADLSAWGAPASLVPVVSEHLAWRFGWDGRGEMPIEERRLLHGLVATAHREGRRVRFFGVPQRPRRVREAHWRELSAVGVDLIATGRHRQLARFLRRCRTGVPGSMPALGHAAGRQRTARTRSGRAGAAPAQAAAAVRRRLRRSSGIERAGTR